MPHLHLIIQQMLNRVVTLRRPPNISEYVRRALRSCFVGYGNQEREVLPCLQYQVESKCTRLKAFAMHPSSGILISGRKSGIP